jgi:hypothetical protein
MSTYDEIYTELIVAMDAYHDAESLTQAKRDAYARLVAAQAAMAAWLDAEGRELAAAQTSEQWRAVLTEGSDPVTECADTELFDLWVELTSEYDDPLDIDVIAALANLMYGSPEFLDGLDAFADAWDQAAEEATRRVLTERVVAAAWGLFEVDPWRDNPAPFGADTTWDQHLQTLYTTLAMLEERA